MNEKLAGERLLDIVSTWPGHIIQRRFQVALEYRQHEILGMLLWDSRAKINRKDHCGRTTLHLAVIYDDPVSVAIRVPKGIKECE